MSEKKKHPGGRPSKYGGIDLRQVELLVRRGWTDLQMAEFFGVAESTWHLWKKEHPKFSESLIDWKLDADAKVERSLYETAIGYEVKELTEELVAGNGLTRIREAGIEYTNDDWLGALEAFDNCCAYCGKSGKMTKDHVVPLSKGGKLQFGNVVPCCQSCNSRKKDREFLFWYKQDEAFDQDRLDKINAYLDDCQQILADGSRDSEPCLTLTKRVTKRFPPSPKVQIFWLKNRQPEKWRDKKEFEGSISLEQILAETDK